VERLFKKGMTFEEKCDALLSDTFQSYILSAKPTLHADIYYRSPFNDKHQHLFRVVDMDLIMRPSCIPNKNTGSVNLQCIISCRIDKGDISIKWSGEALTSIGRDASELFI